jgi:hypothetical protein
MEWDWRDSELMRWCRKILRCWSWNSVIRRLRLMRPKTPSPHRLCYWNAVYVEHSQTLHTLFTGAPFLMDRTIRTSTIFTDGKSRLLWRTCKSAAAAGLFITKQHSRLQDVFPSTEAKWNGIDETQSMRWYDKILRCWSWNSVIRKRQLMRTNYPSPHRLWFPSRLHRCLSFLRAIISLMCHSHWVTEWIPSQMNHMKILPPSLNIRPRWLNHGY